MRCAGDGINVSGAGVLLAASSSTNVATVGAVSVCADARLDNREELRQRFRLPDTAQDAQLIAAGWQRHGESLLDLLEGDFAFAVWDGRKLILARDPTGQRPLHVWRHSERLHFSSLPLEFAAFDGFEARVDVKRLNDLVSLRPELGPETFVAGVERIEPGHLLVAGESRQRCWWSPPLDPIAIGFDNAVDAVRAELERAVRAQSATERPVITAQLSGGIDSSAVVAAAADVIGGTKPIVAISGASAGVHRSVPDTYFTDEAAVAAQTVAMLAGVTHQVVTAEPECPVIAFRRWNRQVQRPLLNPENAHWLDATYRAAAAAGADTVLEAPFGNMTISYTGLDRLAALARSLRLRTLLREARQYSAKSDATLAGALRHALSPLVPPQLFEAVDRLRGLRPVMVSPAAFLRTQHRRDERSAMESALGPRRQLLGLAFTDPAIQRAAIQRTHGVEARDPTASRRLVELCLRLPSEVYFGEGVPRRLGRALVRGRVAPRVYEERRRGYQGSTWPVGDAGTRERMREEIDAVRKDPQLDELFDVAAMEQAMDEGQESSHHGLIRVLSAANFARSLPLMAADFRG